MDKPKYKIGDVVINGYTQYLITGAEFRSCEWLYLCTTKNKYDGGGITMIRDETIEIEEEKLNSIA